MVVVGAGAAGLAVAALLQREGIRPVVLEAGDEPGTAWRARYERLRLHTPRLLSGLPGYRIPRRYGRWVGRDDLARYLQDYAARHALDVRVRTPALRIDRGAPGWTVQTPGGPMRAAHVVLATGYCNLPHVPDWPGLHSFRGELVHSSHYQNAEPFRGRDVLCVGSGNSGAEIAVDLVDGGASRVRIAIRTPPHIVKRASFGIPAQLLGIALRKLPPRVGAWLQRNLRRLTIPDLASYGIPVPSESVGDQFARTGTVPVLDVGFVDAVRRARVEVVAAVAGFDRADVLLTDGTRIRPDVVVAATGFRPGLEPLVGELGVLDEHGLPRDDEPEPGLHFLGYRPTLGGTLRLVAQEAPALAARIAASDGRRAAAQDALLIG